MMAQQYAISIKESEIINNNTLIIFKISLMNVIILLTTLLMKLLWTGIIMNTIYSIVLCVYFTKKIVTYLNEYKHDVCLTENYMLSSQDIIDNIINVVIVNNKFMEWLVFSVMYEILKQCSELIDDLKNLIKKHELIKEIIDKVKNLCEPIYKKYSDMMTFHHNTNGVNKKYN